MNPVFYIFTALLDKATKEFAKADIVEVMLLP